MSCNSPCLRLTGQSPVPCRCSCTWLNLCPCLPLSRDCKGGPLCPVHTRDRDILQCLVHAWVHVYVHANTHARDWSGKPGHHHHARDQPSGHQQHAHAQCQAHIGDPTCPDLKQELCCPPTKPVNLLRSSASAAGSTVGGVLNTGPGPPLTQV